MAVTLLVNDPVRLGERYRFTVRLANMGGSLISLDPCPHYRVQMMKLVETGFLNCAAAPGAIPAHRHVDFAMEIATRSVPYGPSADLLWQLGGEGTEGATATTWVPIAAS